MKRIVGLLMVIVFMSVMFTPVATATGQVTYGDPTGDNWVSGRDVQWIAEYLAGKRDFTKWQMVVSDYNRDGRLTIGDVLGWSRYVSGLVIHPLDGERLGDPTGDGRVTSADYQLILDYVVGRVSGKPAGADLNRDGMVNIGDALILIQVVQGLRIYPAFNPVFNRWLGDLNRDFRVDGTDVKMLGEHLVGWRVLNPGQKLAADMNNDGVLLVNDSMFLTQLSEGKIRVPLP